MEVERESNTAIPIDEERADAVGCPTQPTPKPKLEGSREADEDAQLSQGLHRENEQKAGPRRVGRAESEEGELPALFQEPGEDERVLDEPDSVHSVDRVAEPQEVLRMGEARAFVGLDPVLDKLARLLLSDLEKQEPK
ncbi:MAG: hypothetical protein HY051_02845 [Candidatus Aenigmarchaeota archaeon]|nr:hypothetical protein [Candidatus Aenigmarchaeota archaeon]